MAPGKGKNLRVIAPLSFVGTSVSLEIGDLEIDVPSPVVLGSSSQGLRAEGIFHISSPRAEGHATLIATGNTPEDVATAELIVKFDSGMSGFRPRFEISTDPKPRYRSLLKKASDGVLTSYIFPEHPSYLGAFGKFDGQKFLSEESDDVRAIIAITHAERIAAYMAERSGEKNPDWDVAKNLQVFFDKHQQLAEILGKIFSESDSG